VEETKEKPEEKKEKHCKRGKWGGSPKRNPDGCKNKKPKHCKNPLRKLFKILMKNPAAQEFCQNFQGPRVICDSCNKNIDGLRYKCSVCEDFDFCETCEDTVQHLHPFIKIKPGQNFGNRRGHHQGGHGFGGHGGFGRHGGFGGFGHLFGNLIQQFAPLISGGGKPKKYKAFIVEHLLKKNQEVHPGEVIQAGWTIKNVGTKDWPEGTKLVFCKGSLKPLEERILPAVPAGQTLDIITEFITPMELGKQKGIWKIHLGEKRFGRFPIRVINKTPETLEEKLAHMVAMGFDVEEARNSLEAASGDLNQAVSQVLHKA